MQQIVNFLIKYKNTLLFLLLFFVSLVFTVQSHAYHKSKFINSANFLTGGVYNWVNNIEEYFNLKEYNTRLVEENKYLRSRLGELNNKSLDTVYQDTSSFDNPFQFTSAKVVRNQYVNIDNYILINKGKHDSIKNDLGVITSRGIVGIVEESSAGFSRVISILNSNSSISVQLKNTNHFGSLIWNGKDPNIVQLEEVPRLAPVKVGDTITTDGRSFIFPKGVPVGVVDGFNLDQNQSYYKIDVRLFNDMTNIGYVYVISNKNIDEIKSLELNE
ncbi:rod shape-determining protein MreC [Mesonia aestuariivivens]|uniref:Cell shape-determining protein MreC n=1 Tax=Mesonia aestuariivivens TaxID=2796128 RepID=A0ABS6VZG9_9FLAO|nr:rod shape-determining protein MreC [Mesonia aestuariivivens]MBW2960998.1 rod shape-determining protein MreC [Mesonia aestuariivivens]